MNLPSLEEKTKEIFDSEINYRESLFQIPTKDQRPKTRRMINTLKQIRREVLALLKDHNTKLDDLMTEIKEQMKWNTERLRADDEPKSERRISVLSARIDTLEWILKKLKELRE